METAELIKHYRKIKNISQKELAELANISITALQNYEYGKRSPNMDTLQNIAIGLGVTIQYLTESDEASVLNNSILLIKKTLEFLNEKKAKLDYDASEIYYQLAHQVDNRQELPLIFERIKKELKDTTREIQRLQMDCHIEAHRLEDILRKKEEKNKLIMEVRDLSPQEQKIFNDEFEKEEIMTAFFEKCYLLNETGQKKLQEYANDLLKIDDYRNEKQ